MLLKKGREFVKDFNSISYLLITITSKRNRICNFPFLEIPIDEREKVLTKCEIERLTDIVLKF